MKSKKKHKINPFAKTVEQDEPYAVYAGHTEVGWTEYRVLKTYNRPDKTDWSSMWFIAVKSDATFGSFQMGDEPVPYVVGPCHLIESTPEWKAHFGSDWHTMILNQINQITKPQAA